MEGCKVGTAREHRPGLYVPCVWSANRLSLCFLLYRLNGHCQGLRGEKKMGKSEERMAFLVLWNRQASACRIYRQPEASGQFAYTIVLFLCFRRFNLQGCHFFLGNAILPSIIDPIFFGGPDKHFGREREGGMKDAMPSMAYGSRQLLNFPDGQRLKWGIQYGFTATYF